MLYIIFYKNRDCEVGNIGANKIGEGISKLV